jgi:GT2 family glycosyltransferase
MHMSCQIWFGDIDFCLRLRAKGLHILFEPAICALHHESKTVRSLLSGHNSEQYWRRGLEVTNKRWGRACWKTPALTHISAGGTRHFHQLLNLRWTRSLAILVAARALIRGGFSAVRKRLNALERHCQNVRQIRSCPTF